jgi:4-diphosphocytidyl-2-C-methyl-D-erythritol kinase
MAVERSIARRAFAKINLHLRVLGARPDGYHELRTTFQSIALADTLTFSCAPGPFRIECDDPACPIDRRNLVWRAAQQVWKAARRRGGPRDVTVRIAKRIPMQAGLGGGSSDVPYFLEGGTALGLDRGDRLFPLVDIPRAWVALVVPAFGVSTKDAFAWWDADVRTRRDTRKGQQGRAAPGQVSNDLQTPVAKRHPIVARLVAALQREGAFHASLSGSGSAVFGLFARKSEAERAAQSLKLLSGRQAGQIIIVTRTLARAECRRLAAK